MVIPIDINQQDLLDQFSISKKEMEDVVDFTIKEITAQFAIRWEEQARLELSSTRDRYISNLRVVDEGRMAGAVILDYSKDPLIKMLEEGASAFDMKEGFAKSAKKHDKKDGGWYLTIPFKIGTPGSQQSSGFAHIMPTQIYNIAKKLPVSPTTDKSKGIGKADLPSGFEIPKTRVAFSSIPKSQTFEEYKNKASIYQGVFKQTDSVTGQSSYGSFRRVSDKSDVDSWIFPGLESKNLGEKALQRFEVGMQQVLETAMDNALSYFGIE